MSDDNIQSWEVDFVVGYANHGKQLPRTKEEYCTRLHISGDAATKISGYIEPLIAVYAPEQEECQYFYDKSYPAASETASSALTIAQRAVYGLENADIVQAIKDIDNASSDEERQRLQRIIADGIDSKVQTLVQDRDQAQKVLDGLVPLKERTPQDCDALKAFSLTADVLLGAEEAILNDLQTLLAEILVAAGQLGNSSAAILAQIEEYKNKISNEQAVINALYVIRDDTSMTRLLLDRAIDIVRKMTTEWSTIHDSLYNLREMVDSNLRNASAVLVDRVVANLVIQWKELKDRVKAYRSN